jgi:hypothetical protein
LSQIIRPSETQNNFIGDILAISVNEELLGRGKEEMLKMSDPLLLFGMEIASFQGNYAGVGKTTTYAPPTKKVE